MSGQASFGAQQRNIYWGSMVFHRWDPRQSAFVLYTDLTYFETFRGAELSSHFATCPDLYSLKRAQT